MDYKITAYSRIHRRAYPVGDFVNYYSEDQTILTLAREYQVEFAIAISYDPKLPHWLGNIVHRTSDSRPAIVQWVQLQPKGQ